MPLSPAQRYSLAAASAVEAYAGSSLVLAPQRFIRRTYGVRGPLDPLTVKFARCVCSCYSHTPLLRSAALPPHAGTPRGCVTAPEAPLFAARLASRSLAWAC